MITRERPTKKFQFKEPLESELRNVYKFLANLDTGLFGFRYRDSDGKLYLLHNGVSLATFDATGNLSIIGTLTQSATLDDISHE